MSDLGGLLPVFEASAEELRRRAAPRAEIVARDDLLLVTHPLEYPWANHVHWARWDDASAERGIDEVLAFFRERRRRFVWSVGPSTTPRDLGERLLRRGLVLEVDGALLAARLPIAGLRVDPSLAVREISALGDVVRAVRLEHEDWEGTRVAEVAADLAARIERGLVHAVLAFRGATPVATARWRVHADRRVVYLSGAFTAPAERRRGAYSTLVAYRAEHGRARGCAYAAITADRATSAPILATRGFVEIGAERIYLMPSGAPSVRRP